MSIPIPEHVPVIMVTGAYLSHTDAARLQYVGYVLWKIRTADGKEAKEETPVEVTRTKEITGTAKLLIEQQVYPGVVIDAIEENPSCLIDPVTLDEGCIDIDLVLPFLRATFPPV